MASTKLEPTMRGRLRAAPRFAATVSAAIALGACAGGGSESAEVEDAPKLVLDRTDLPAGWQAFDVGRQLPTDVGARLVTRGAWKARYRRAGAASAGPLVIESRADVFESDEEAEDGLATLEGLVPTLLPGGTQVDLPPLGDAAFGATNVERSSQRNVRYFLVAWRHGNVTALLLVNGFEPLRLAEVVALARKQERRIAAGSDP